MPARGADSRSVAFHNGSDENQPLLGDGRGRDEERNGGDVEGRVDSGGCFPLSWRHGEDQIPNPHGHLPVYSNIHWYVSSQVVDLSS